MKKLIVSLLLTVLVATLGLGWLFDYAYSTLGSSRQNHLQHLEEMAGRLSLALDNLESGRRQQFVEKWNGNSEVYISLNQAEDFHLPPEIRQGFLDGEALLLEADGEFSLNHYMPNSQAILTIGFPESRNFPEKGFPLRIWFTLSFYLMLMASLIFWLYPLIKRLLVLQAASRRFGKGEFSHRVPIDKGSYIAEIEVEFNSMAQRMEQLISDIKLISGAMAHDLRTPIARIQLGLDNLEEEDNPGRRMDFHRRLNRDIGEMTSLVDNLLEYVKLDRTLMEMARSPLDLASLVSQCCDTFPDDERNMILLETGNKMELVMGNTRFMTMLVNNLLSNAFKYARNKIIVSVQSDGLHTSLMVEDDGPGVIPEDRSKITNPFVRGPEPGKEKGKAYGMGLAIVKKIAEAQQGNLHIDTSSRLGGARFTVTFPFEKGKSEM